MSTSARTELLSQLGELSRACPEMRFGQLVANLAVVARGTDLGAVWEMEDEELLAAVNWQLAELLSRRGEEVPPQSLQQTGHAKDGSPSFSVPPV